MNDAKSDMEEMWALMKELDYCVLVTHSPAGLVGRPMTAIVDVERRALHMLCERTSSAALNIMAKPEALLTFSNGSSKHVVLNAAATILDDRELVAKLWNTGAQAFWPNGPKDPSVVAAMIEPISGEYWLGSGGIVGAAKFAYAVATGARPDMGQNAKVSF